MAATDGFQIRIWNSSTTDYLAFPSLSGLSTSANRFATQNAGTTFIQPTSGAIIEYILEVYGGGRLRPAAGTEDWVRYLQWMHFCEGSLLPAMIPTLLASGAFGGAPKPEFDHAEREIMHAALVVVPGEDAPQAEIFFA